MPLFQTVYCLGVLQDDATDLMHHNSYTCVPPLGLAFASIVAVDELYFLEWIAYNEVSDKFVLLTAKNILERCTESSWTLAKSMKHGNMPIF